MKRSSLWAGMATSTTLRLAAEVGSTSWSFASTLK